MLEGKETFFGIEDPTFVERRTAMIRKFLTLLAFLGAALALTRTAAAQINLGITADRDGISSFYLSIGSYYKAPETEVRVVRQGGIPDDELAVVFFIAKKAGVPPKTIMNLRLKGMGWYAISQKYGLTAADFYVPLRRDPGPPYGKAYGHYKKVPKNQWRTVRLDDDDIVNLVNLRFISEYHGYEADDVVRMRTEGRNFVVIEKDVKQKKGKGGPPAHSGPPAKADSPGQGGPPPKADSPGKSDSGKGGPPSKGGGPNKGKGKGPK